MPKIFVSYRRADSEIISGRIYDRLRDAFGAAGLFKDVDDMPPDRDFRGVLWEAVATCDVMLVIIGPDWLTVTNPDGQRRLDDPEDLVRMEVQVGLERDDCLVIPVLVKGAQMPTADELPPALLELAFNHALEIRNDPDFHHDMDRLIKHLKLHLTPDVQDILPPPFEWIEIPAGQVTLEEGWDDEAYGAGQTFDVPSFAIAKYPVTVTQYAVFVGTGGYKERRWWTEKGWQVRKKAGWAERRYWLDEKWNSPQQPVVGVSWYEAVAFCLWLSGVTGENIMLLTETQWQWAARGDDGREYPWGNEWDCTRCNNSVAPCDSNATSPVTRYEGKSDSPFGVVDMAGNVWEWCLTDYESGSNNVDTDAERRVLRGGSWNFRLTDYFRVASRGGDYPYFRYSTRGFRCARSY